MQQNRVVCKFCGAKIIDGQTCQDLYNQVAFYTLNHAEPEFFIHQLVVDAYAAQHTADNQKPIKLAFALIGLYLFSEKSYSGREVQLAHMQLGKVKRDWPPFDIPQNRGKITVTDVLNVKAGASRDQMIKSWAQSTWQAFISNRVVIINTLIEVEFRKSK